ncbi:serine/threonine protein kinase [Minicystis rosea]|nr:serine/threonine protein kinase [Minicystis rosea]
MEGERHDTGPRALTFKPGHTIDGGKYRMARLLGEGGMGAVYEGENTRIRRRVAIKVLHQSIAAKADAVARFEREAQAAGRIGSDHIVEVIDLGSTPEGDRFMVMELLEGESLGDRIRRKGRLPAAEIAGILHQLLAGLGAAHEAGIVHRDLKPDNVFLAQGRAGRRDFVKILDFGVSKFAVDTDLSMTSSGAVVGTPFYMSPEQARGQEIDARSDLFSVGVVAYQAVTGRVPFNAATFNELVFKIALESPVPAGVAAPDLDAGFAAIITRAMVRNPAGRYQSAAELQAAITAWAVEAGVPIDPDDTLLPPRVPRALDGVSAVELGLAKTVSGDSLAPIHREHGAGAGRTMAIGAAAMLAMIVGGLGAYGLLGHTSGRMASAAGGPVTMGPQAPAFEPPAIVASTQPSASPAPTEAEASATAAPVATQAPVATEEPKASAKPVVKAKPAITASPTAAPLAAVAKDIAKPATPIPMQPLGRTIGSEL